MSDKLTKQNSHWFQPFFKHSILDNIFGDDFFQKEFPLSALKLNSGFTTNLSKDPTKYVYEISVAGFEEKQITITVKDNILKISAKSENKDEKSGSYTTNSFDNSFTLPVDSATEDLTAEYKAGLLTVTVPRKEQKQSEERIISLKKNNNS